MTRITLAALALASLAPAAIAQPQSEIAIPVAQVDLNDNAQVATIEARIADAAEQVCRDRVVSDLLRAYTLRDCIEATTAHAMEQLDARRGVAPLSAAEDQLASSER
ncbi:MAG: UrcA family protein [Pseudomonadota bacterium]|nr:UrcA family protein [Pseudomonadota bacterium]